MLQHIFDDMGNKSRQLGKSGYLLGGDTGVGKTSFAKDLSILMGLELLIIETPHIVEEHIIDIPFIVIKPSGEETRKDLSIDAAKSDYDIKFAKSYLYSSLVSAKKESDSSLLAKVKSRPDLFLIWEKLGGSGTKIPDEIKELRSSFKAILFLDEYFRQTSNSIRNMLRSILNGRIGSSTMPEDVYVLFASNLIDSGVGEILPNEEFKKLNFNTPDLDVWIAYIITKYSNNPKIKLDDELIKRFYDLLKKNEGSLSTDDLEADVRISPRRWEQLILYINSAMPVKDQKDADILLKNVEVNFKNYITGKNAKIAKAVMDTVKALIKERQKISANENNVEDHDWHETLKHQIEAKMKIGAARTYVPVVGGLPGTGKTSHITNLATDLNMVPVYFDVQNPSPEDVIGTPLAKTSKTGEISVTFSRPALYEEMQSQMEEGKDKLEERLVKYFGKKEGAEKFKAWKTADYKYLIFFDEFNRAKSVKVFNAVRKVLLEKEFNNEYKLPKESILVAAINPTGEGTLELTKHVRDVFDNIPVGISWAKFSAHLLTLQLPGKESADISRAAVNAFIERFRVKGQKIENADPHFFLGIGDIPLYISPREITDMLIMMAQKVKRAYDGEMSKITDLDHDFGKSEQLIRKAMYLAADHSIDFIIKEKHKFNSAEFDANLKDWFMNTDEINVGSVFKQKVESVKNLKDLLNKTFINKDADLFNDLEFDNYIRTVDNVKFAEDLTEFLVDSVVKDSKKVFANFSKRKELKGKKVNVTDVEVSKLEFILREIVHSLKLHSDGDGTSNKMVDAVKISTKTALIKISKTTDDNDSVLDAQQLYTVMTKYIKTINE